MGTVYKAEHIHFCELRALKVITPDAANDKSLVKRFMQEAKLARRLQHPNIVRVHDVETAEDGRPFIVMEFIDGRPLKDALDADASMPVLRACTIAKQTAAALNAAHRLRIVHRDITPANIILVGTHESEQVKVLDFGIAKLRQEGANRRQRKELELTRSGVIVGTPAYMSPEQAIGRSGDVDERSDLYSLGVLMYQMFAGTLPFTAGSFDEFCKAHVEAPPKPIKKACPALPDQIADLVMTCLAKKPADRPHSALAIVESIDRWENGGHARETALLQPSAHINERTRPATTRPARFRAPERTTTRRKWALAIGSAAVMLFLAALVFRLAFIARETSNLPRAQAPRPTMSLSTSKTPPSTHPNTPVQIIQESASRRIKSQQPRKTITGQTSRKKQEGIQAEYDSLTARLAAVEESLKQRTADLKDPIKPEITGAIRTSQADLLAAHKLLMNGNIEDAVKRLDRVKEALKYLESL